MSISIVSDSFAPFGTINVGPPERPEKSSEQRAADRAQMTLRELLKEQRWTIATYEQARDLYCFPKRINNLGRDGRDEPPVFRRSAVDQWFVQFRAFAAQVK